MSFDKQSSYAATSANKSSIGIRSFIQEILTICVIVSSAAVAFLLVDVKSAIDKNNQLTDQQIKVTRSMHFVHELAIAHLEGRRASEAAEKADIPPLPDEDDFKSQFEFQK